MSKKRLDSYAAFDPEPQKINPVFEGLGSQYSIGTKSPEFSGDYGMKSTTKYDVGTSVSDIPNIDRIRGERQPVLSQVGAFANQAVLGEVVGGTIMTLGALAEIPSLIYDGLTESESGFNNAIFEAGDNLSKWTRDVTPIYQTGDRFSDTGWWLQNGVSVASAASMLLPGAAVAKGVGKLGQLMKWSKTATELAQTGLGALTMRHAENFREANGVFQTVYNDALNKGIDEETAKQNASDAASIDYGANYANLAFDMIQLGALMKPLKSWTRNVGGLEYDLAKGLGKLPESKLGKAMYWSKDKLLPQMSEGVEEVINTISQKESERYGKILNDPSTADKTDFMGRLGDYMGDTEVIDSFIWGVAGGVAFQGLGKALGLDQGDNVVKNKLAEVTKRQETLGNYLSNINAATNKETITNSKGEVIEDFKDSDAQSIQRYVNSQVDKMAFDLSQSASRSGNVDLLLEQIESPDFKKQMVDSGVTTSEEANDRVTKIKKEVELGEKLYKQSFNRFYNLDVDQTTKNYLTDKATALEYGRAKVAEVVEDLKKDYNTNYNDDAYLKSYGALPAVQNTIDVMSHQMAIEGLTQQLQSARKEDKEDIEKTIVKLNTSLQSIQSNRFGTVDSNLINPLVFESKARQLVFQHQFDNLSEDIANTQSPESIKDAKDKVEKNKKDIKTNISNNQVTKKKEEKTSRIESNKTIIKDTSKFTLKPEDAPTQEEIDRGIDEGEVIDTLGEDEMLPTEEVVETPKLQEYNTRKQDLDLQKEEALNQLKSTELHADVDLSTEKNDVEEAYKYQLQELNKVYVDSIPSGEQLEIKVQDTVDKTSTIIEGYTEECGKEVNNELDAINDNFLDNDLIKKLNDSFNTVARLDREYGIKNGKYVEVSNELHPNLFTPVLNPDKYQPGTKVTLRVADRNDIPVTDPITGMVTTWGSLKNQVNFVDTVPIEIVDVDGNVLGFYHDTNWTSNSDKVANPVTDTEVVKNVRNEVVSKGSIDTTIIENRFGVLNRTMNNTKIPFNEVVEDPNVVIAAAKDSIGFFGDNNQYNLINNFSKTPLQQGFNYMIVKVGKKLGTDAHLAIPIDNMKYDELFKHNEELFHNIHTSIETAVNVYIKDGKNLTPTEQALYESVKKNIDKDISIADGIKYYLEGFLYNDKRKFAERSQFKFDGGNITFRRKNPIKGQATQFFVGRNVKDREKSMQIFKDNLESALKAQVFNTGKEFLDANVSLPLVNERGEIIEIKYLDLVKSVTKTNVMGKEVDTNSDGSKAYSYTIQKVIRFDTSFVEPNPTGTRIDGTNIVTTKYKKFWKDGSGKYNNATSFSLINKLNEKFELVKDIESNYYSIHFKTSSKNALTELEKQSIIAEISKYLPINSKLATWGEITKGGINGLSRFKNFGFVESGEFREIKDTSGNIMVIPILLKQEEFTNKTDDYEELDEQEFNFVDDLTSFAVSEDKISELGNSLKSILVKDLGFARQEDIVSYISEKILSKLSESGTVNITEVTNTIKESFNKNINTIEFNIKKVKSNIIKAKQSNKVEDLAKFESQLANLEAFKNLLNEVNKNWDILVSLTKKKVERLNGLKVIDNQDDDTETGNDLFEIEGDENANWKESDLTTDRKNSISRDAKLFCSGILELDSNGNPIKNWIGVNRLMSFDVVYNTVQSLTPNLAPDIDVIKEQLSNHVDANPWLKDFIEKLDKADAKTKKSLVKAVTNYYSNTTGYKYSTDSNGNYFVRLFKSDVNATGKLILNSWESNFMKSELVSTQEQSKINESVADEWINKFNNIVTTKGVKVTIDDVNELLNSVGINLTPEALNHIATQGISISKKEKVTLSNILSNGHSPLVVIKKFLELNKGEELLTKLTTETAIEKLASIQNRYETKLHSNSQRSGGRTIFSYGKPKFFINRFRRFFEFTEGKDTEMGKVLNSPFVTNLLWSQSIKDVKTREAFLANLDYEIADLEPISELGKSSKTGRELNNLSPIEVELHALFGLSAKRADKSGGKNRVISLKHPTTSDKTTVHSIITLAADLRFNNDGSLTNESYKILFDNLILPEITRIRHFESLRNQGSDITRFEGWADGWNKFLVIPEMNAYPELFIGDNLNPELESNYQTVIDKVLKPHVESLIADKVKLWDEYSIGIDTKNDKGKVVESMRYLDKSHIEQLIIKGGKDNVRLAAINDMIGQYLIGNVNSWGLFTTDPAQYFDKKAVRAWKDGNKDLAVQKVYENMGKRLAADVAPGEESVASVSGNITYAFVKDPNVTSSRFDQLRAQFGDGIADAYKGMDGTDAQEFVTLQEHLFNMDSDGLLSDGMYDSIAKTITEEVAKGNHYYSQAILDNLNTIDPKLAEQYNHYVFQVKKPVYVENVWDNDLGVERRVYVKTSAYPLTPELCAQIQMDDIRITMEKQGIQRLAFATATKVGNYKKNIELFDKDNNVLPNIDFSSSTMVVPRSGLRDQMPVPYDPNKKDIKKVSQASKNLFVNIKDIPGMRELEIEYMDTYHAIFKEQYDGLVNDILDTRGNLNIPKLKEILLEEASGRGYPLSDYQMLELDENLKLLPFSPNAAKYESLLNSIVENRVNKIMIPGKSFVLSTEMGYKIKPTEKIEGNKENISKLHGVVFTKNFTGELLPQRLEDGVVKPSQVIMPFKFRDNNGNLLHIEDFMDANGLVDLTKLPEDILKLFGMRIPNQGPNSQSAIEIVGFMPHNAGDVIVASKDYLAQMGSDFDVDKLYTYVYETTFKDDKLFKKDSLKNKIVDIHLKIHSNPDPRVQRQIAKPIGEWKLKSIADEIAKLQPKSTTRFSPASDNYQKMKFINATSGKAGVSTYSVASMFVANSQGKGLTYKITNKDGSKSPIQLVIGTTTWNGDLSNIFTIKSQELIASVGGYNNLTDEQVNQLTYKSEVVEGHQSVAVDNEKLQLMDKTNDNKFTFNYTIAAMSAGFEEKLVWLRSQPIIFDYVKELQFLKSPVSGFFGNAEEEAAIKVRTKYQVVSNLKTLNTDSAILLTTSNMKRCIGGNSESFTATQGVALDMFLALHEVGLKIQSVTSATNTDSKGLGITVLTNIAKQQAIENLANSPIENATRLLGDFNEDNQLVNPSTLAGFATFYGLNTANKYWSQLFPYQTTSVQELFKTIEELTNSEDVGFNSKARNQQDIWNDFKSYLFSRNDLGITDEGVDVNTERDRLFIDRKNKSGEVTKKSFVSTMQEIAQLPEMQRRPFINRLNFTIDYTTGKTSRISFNAAAAENLEETQIYQDIIDLLVNDRPIPNQKKELVKKNILSITTIQNADKKAHTKASLSNKFIGFADGIINSSTGHYSRQLSNVANLGTYSSDDIVFVSIPGKRGDLKIAQENINKTIQETILAINSGATIITDNKNYTDNSSYNIGEKQLKTVLENLNIPYSEQVVDGNMIGIWNNKEESITTRQMMEDLIKTQYLGGGIQEAIQFIKYIPAQYYYLVPFADKISNIWNELNTTDNKWLNFSTDSLPNFIEQWIQHNPTKATDVSIDNFKMNKDNTFTVVDENILNKVEDKLVAEPYIKRYNAKSKVNKTELFKSLDRFDSDGNPLYQQIPTLGAFGMMEYNANLPQGVSQGSLLMTIKTPDVVTKEENTNSTSEIISNPLKEVNQVEEISNKLGITTNETPLKDILEKVNVTTANPYYQMLSEELVKLAGNITMKLDKSIRTSGKAINGKLSINTDLIANPARLADVILHESLHGIADSTINQFLTDKSKLPSKVREACTSLETLRQTLESRVKNTKEYKEWENKMKDVRNNKKAAFTSEEVTKLSSLENLKEFLAYSMSRSETQKWLNSIEYKDGKTALDRFVELINKMIQSLIGKVDVTKGSALEAAIRDSVVIINAQELYESDVIITKPKFDISKATLKSEDFVESDVVDSLAVYEEEPFNSLPSKKDIYNQFKIWDNNLNNPKTWSMNVDMNVLVKIAQNVNKNNEIYSAKVAQQQFLEKGKYSTKQYIQLNLKSEMNELNTRMEYLMNDKEKMEELMKTCKY